MVRKLIPLAVLIVLVLGCKKTVGDASDGGTVDGGPGGPAYTIRVREQPGDTCDVVETVVGVGGINSNGQARKGKQEKKAEYSETIIDVSAEGRPTTLTRRYKSAWVFHSTTNATKQLPHAGKTVTIQYKEGGRTFTIDGEKMGAVDTDQLAGDFSVLNRTGLKEMLPKSAVQVGEPWPIDPVTAKAIVGGDAPVPVVNSKSKCVGKLTKVYTKDGHQWGVINLDIDVAFDSKSEEGQAKAQADYTGSMKMIGTLDIAIDGSVPDGTATLTIGMDVTINGSGQTMRMGSVAYTKTIKSVK